VKHIRLSQQMTDTCSVTDISMQYYKIQTTPRKRKRAYRHDMLTKRLITFNTVLFQWVIAGCSENCSRSQCHPLHRATSGNRNSTV